MVTRHFAKNVSVSLVSFTVMEYVISEATGWVGWYCMTTNTITFVWVKFLDVKSMEVVWIVTMHCVDLCQAPKQFSLVLKCLEDLAWFSGWWAVSDCAKCTGLLFIPPFLPITSPQRLSELGSLFCMVRETAAATKKLLWASASFVCQLVCSFIVLKTFMAWDPL